MFLVRASPVDASRMKRVGADEASGGGCSGGRVVIGSWGEIEDGARSRPAAAPAPLPKGGAKPRLLTVFDLSPASDYDPSTTAVATTRFILELVQGVDQEILETALPKMGGSVLVLYGQHKGVYGNLMDRNTEKETGVVRDADSYNLIKGTNNQLLLLEKLNQKVAEEYNSSGDVASGVRVFVEQLSSKNEGFQEYVQEIEKIDQQVTEFEAVVSMLDKYTSLLEKKLQSACHYSMPT